jgi:hypothetical protein
MPGVQIGQPRNGRVLSLEAIGAGGVAAIASLARSATKRVAAGAGAGMPGGLICGQAQKSR